MSSSGIDRRQTVRASLALTRVRIDSAILIILIMGVYS